MRILNFGSLNLDYVYRVHEFVRPGETVASIGRKTVCGGKGLNQSIAAARSGAEVWHAGNVGASDGAMLRDALKDAGVRCEWLRDVPEVSGHTFIQVNDAGENSIVLYAGANHCVDEAQIRTVLDPFGPDTLVMLQNEINLIPAIMKTAKEKGMKIAVNPSPLSGVDALPLEEADFLFVNRDEAAYLTGSRDVKAMGRRFEHTRSFITLGSEGAWAVGGGKPDRFQAAFPVRAVDTTGAGDTFMGYTLGLLSRGMEEAQCMRLAARASSISVTRLGAAPSIPLLREVEDAEGQG